MNFGVFFFFVYCVLMIVFLLGLLVLVVIDFVCILFGVLFLFGWFGLFVMVFFVYLLYVNCLCYVDWGMGLVVLLLGIVIVIKGIGVVVGILFGVIQSMIDFVVLCGVNIEDQQVFVEVMQDFVFVEFWMMVLEIDEVLQVSLQVVLGISFFIGFWLVIVLFVIWFVQMKCLGGLLESVCDMIFFMMNLEFLVLFELVVVLAEVVEEIVLELVEVVLVEEVFVEVVFVENEFVEEVFIENVQVEGVFVEDEVFEDMVLDDKLKDQFECLGGGLIGVEIWCFDVFCIVENFDKIQMEGCIKVFYCCVQVQIIQVGDVVKWI